MMENDLDIRFQKAVALADEMSQASLPQDIQLRLYAFYKQATFGNLNPAKISNFDLRNAFKTNAWMQISHLTPEQAKEEYISAILLLQKK
jgi:acyl-CoA-binding protein